MKSSDRQKCAPIRNAVFTPRLKPIAAIITASLAAHGFAQTPAPKDDAVALDSIVVTATSQEKSKMRSSVSVTDVSQEQIKDFGMRSESEILLLIPGIRTDGNNMAGGNANISVRGLPITSGGSKYVQLQEDGLPTMQFGDMNFANNDYWIRMDNNVDRIQTLRGGSSSIFASHAPGAVINYVSKTGKESGGSVGLTTGLNYNETRLDGDYGSQIGPGRYFHIGGYYREGEGVRNTVSNSLLGYQLKGNFTQEFDGGKGFFRVNFKLLDEHAPTTAQTFITATKTGSSIGNFALAPGYDGQRDSQYSIYNRSFTSVDPVTGTPTTTSLTDGISVNTKSVGFEFKKDIGDGFTVEDKFRIAKNSGAFQAQFWNVQTLANMLGGFGAGSTARFYNGPNAGALVSAANLPTGLVSQSAAINTQLSDMGNLFNDLSVSKQFAFNGGTADVKAGFYHGRQNVGQRWMISERVVEAKQNGAVIDVFNAAGAALTTAGLTGYNNQWGGCCARQIDAQFTTDAPYLSLNLAMGPLDVDAGIRQETFKVNGTYSGGTTVTGGRDVNGDGKITGAEANYVITNTANPGLADYKFSYTNFSAGANYRVTKDLSTFIRYSEGTRAIADRTFLNGFLNEKTGKVLDAGALVAPVKQAEIGLRFRDRTNWGSYNLAATYFTAKTQESDYDQTRQDNPSKPNYQGPKLNFFGFKSDGIELESGVSFGDFSLYGNMTYTKAVKSADFGNPSQIGKESDGVPRLRFTLQPKYSIGDFAVGFIIRGQGDSWQDGNNTTKMPGYFITNAFVNYNFYKNMSASFNVANLFDKIACTGSGGFVGGSATVFGCGVETGRTFSASVRYTF
jgi:outer membrane receptor protein involved in Fe transport